MADHNEEEQQNIDDLVDYNDFDSKDLDSINDQDSFNDDILKFYEDHKKNTHSKTNEINNAQRPISSYQRVLLTENNKKENSVSEDKDEGVDIDKEMDYNPECEDKFDKSVSIVYEMKDVEEVIARLNNHLSKQGITQQEFCDNENLFLDFSDFREIFKKIRFDLTYKEAKILFSFNNSNKSEGYLHMKHFLSNSKLKFKEVSLLEKVNTDYDIKKMNDEFVNLRNEIFDIVRNDMIESNMKRLGLVKGGKNKMNKNKSKALIPINEAGKYTGVNNTHMSNNLSNNNISLNKRPASSTTKLIPASHLSNKILSLGNKKEKEKFDIGEHLKDSIKKKKEEDLVIKNTIDKRQKEFIRDCMKKMYEANRMAAELRIRRSFTSVTDKDGVIRCLVTDLTEPRNEFNPQRIELKAFIVQWRMLYKAYVQKSNDNVRISRISSANIRINQSHNLARSKSPQLNPKFDKKEIQKQIKKVLVTSIRLKMKLKQQVNSLKQKINIDENVILEHLKLSK